MIKKIKTILINLAKRNEIIRHILRTLSNLLGKTKYLKYYFFNKVDNKLIIFESYGGRNFSDSPKNIYYELLNNPKYKDYKFIWFFQKTENYQFLNNDRTEVVKVRSSSYYKYFSKAKYWIVNSAIEECIIKKRNQLYIQCWHGTPLKRLRCDIEKTSSSLNSVKEIKKRNNIDAKKFDYFISPSSFATSKFISAFNLKNLNKENIIIEKGYPRNDYLFTYTENEVKELREKLGIPKNKKIILYAPTFRDNQHKSGLGYTYDLNIDFEYLKEKLFKEYVILFRTHYFIANEFDFKKYEKFIINVSNYDEINELYIISDILITDYSSVFFDYANLKKPILFYMYDLDEYKNELRNFYIDLKELPGPIVKREKELVNEILNIKTNFKKYYNKYKKFNKKYNYLDDENSTKRVVEEIFHEENN